MLDYFNDTIMVIIMLCNKIRRGFYAFRRVFHGCADSGVLQHPDIIITISTAYHFFPGDSKEAEKVFKTIGFIHGGGANG